MNLMFSSSYSHKEITADDSSKLNDKKSLEVMHSVCKTFKMNLL